MPLAAVTLSATRHGDADAVGLFGLATIRGRSLVSNAVRSTPAGGSVEIRLERRGRVTEIRVTDSGPGIPPELLPHLFEVYRPADAGPTSHPGGLGLGLLIARHLTDLHGGTIRAESAGVGHGTTFTVSFPSPVAP